MARNISVKVPVAALRQQIESKIAEIDKAVEEYPNVRKQYEADKEAYKEAVVAFVAKFLTSNAHTVGYDYDDDIRISRHYGNRFEMSFDADKIEGFPENPDEPERPNQKEWFGRDYVTRKQLLEKNLKILSMTTQEEVSASTYGTIMELL